MFHNYGASSTIGKRHCRHPISKQSVLRRLAAYSWRCGAPRHHGANLSVKALHAAIVYAACSTLNERQAQAIFKENSKFSFALRLYFCVLCLSTSTGSAL